MEIGGGGGGGGGGETGEEQQQRQLLKAEIAVHPLYEQLLAAHVGCLRVATPIDHLPLIDAQLAQSHGLLRSYAAQHRPVLSPHEKHDLDNFLVSSLSFSTLFSLLSLSLFLLSSSALSILFSFFGFLSNERGLGGDGRRNTCWCCALSRSSCSSTSECTPWRR